MTRVLIPYLFGLSACAVGVAAMAARMVDVTGHPVLFVAVFAPYLMLALPVGAALLLYGRRWLAGLAAVALSAAAVATQLPHRPAPAGNAVEVRVMSANILQGAADLKSVADLARRSADLVSIQELTPQALKELSANGIDDAFPHRLTKPLWGGSGAGLWSRYPLTESPGGQFEGLPIIARLDLPGAAAAPTVVVAHLSAPWPWPIGWWRDDIARATTVLDSMAGPVIAAGDFNSTRDVAQFRRLLATGSNDSAFQDTAARTYPSDRWFPPLLAIDHVLTRECSASRPATVSIPGSDHRAVVAAVAITRGEPRE